MSDRQPETDEEVRQRFARVFGERPDDVADQPVARLRTLLDAVDEQAETYELLGFLTPVEADAAAGR